MRNPRYFNGVFYVSIFTAWMLCIFVSLVSSFAYRDNIQNIITLNLPFNSFTIGVRLIYWLCLLGSYPLQMVALIDIIEQSDIYHSIPNFEWFNLKYYSIRTVYVMFTGFLAVTIPKIELMLNLVGSVGGTFAWLIFPVIIYEKVLQDELTMKDLIIDRLVLVFAIIFGGTSIVVSFVSLIMCF